MFAKSFFLRLAATCIFLAGAAVAGAHELVSPDGRLRLTVEVKQGIPYYRLDFGDRCVLGKSRLGVALCNERGYVGDLVIASIESASCDETWQPVWGEVAQIRNHYNELLVRFLQPDSSRKLDVRFRLFDDGLGFRYEFPEQPTLHVFEMQEELTEFNLGHDYTAFCMPGDYDTSEFTYTTAPLSRLREEIPRQSAAHKSYEAKSAGDLVVQ
ncbi:MAG: glycoside hydrolase family 97 N-terminal domain-containing protein, partial [Alistipes sp.]|nr:glycoside hydrolase family 97 N-terminal domain-containing protein [Alistipes sp.]